MSCKHCGYPHESNDDEIECLKAQNAKLRAEVEEWKKAANEERDKADRWRVMHSGASDKEQIANLQVRAMRLTLELIQRDAEKHSGWWARTEAQKALECCAEKPKSECTHKGGVGYSGAGVRQCVDCGEPEPTHGFVQKRNEGS